VIVVAGMFAMIYTAGMFVVFAFAIVSAPH
jgi:hypothetical protein